MAVRSAKRSHPKKLKPLPTKTLAEQDAALVHFRTLVRKWTRAPLRRVRVRVRVQLELRLGLVRVRIRDRVRFRIRVRFRVTEVRK